MPEIVLVSWNVRRAMGERLDAVARTVSAAGADIALLQEAVEATTDLEALNGGRAIFVPAFPLKRPRPGARHEGMLVWSRLPFDRVERRPLGGWPWPRMAVSARQDGLTVCGLHLSHLPWQRRRQLREAAAALSPPAVLAGDFNAAGRVEAAGFLDATPPGSSFTLGPVRLRLDRLLVSPGVSVVEAGWRDRAGSDHRPLRARIRYE